MLQLAATMIEISGHLERRAHLREDNETTFRWEHDAMSGLTDIVRSSGLAVDDEEAYMLVYSAFEAYGLLRRR